MLHPREFSVVIYPHKNGELIPSFILCYFNYYLTYSNVKKKFLPLVFGIHLLFNLNFFFVFLYLFTLFILIFSFKLRT